MSSKLVVYSASMYGSMSVSSGSEIRPRAPDFIVKLAGTFDP